MSQCRSSFMNHVENIQTLKCFPSFLIKINKLMPIQKRKNTNNNEIFVLTKTK